MEEWLSQLDMGWTNEDIFLNIHEFETQHQQQQQQKQSMDTFNEELALILGDDFPSPFSSGSSNSSYQFAFNNIDNTIPNPVPSNSSISAEQTWPRNDCNVVLVEHPINNNLLIAQPGLPGPAAQQEQNVSASLGNKQDDGGNNGKKKRRREPNQVQDHIMAERKRRELLAQLFIALSAMLPGLKKVDKTTVLGEAIKHMKQLKTNVKELEENVKKLEESLAKQNVESMVMVKRSKTVFDNDEDDSSSTMDSNNGVTAIGGGGGGGASASAGDGDGDGYITRSPNIEVEISNKTLLLRIFYYKKAGITDKIFSEVEKHGNVILTSNITPFGISTLNVTIVAQSEKLGKNHVKNLVKSLNTILCVV